MNPDWGDAARALTDSVTVLVGDAGGGYPSGNSLLVHGRSETVIIDPSVTVVDRGGAPRSVDAVLNSHGHEDHLAGNGFFADARVHIHNADLAAARSLDGLVDCFGVADEMREPVGLSFVEEFHYAPRPDAQGFSDGAIFDLGGVVVEAVHLPGHTAGHSGFRISGGVFFLSDIDLTGFGPYYGDVWSSLDDFDESLRIVRDEEAEFYVTFHQKGVIEGRARFLEMIDDFAEVILRRHAAMLEFLTLPRSLDDMADHRFMYRPHVEGHFVTACERRCAQLHVERMLVRGEAEATVDGRFRTI